MKRRKEISPAMRSTDFSGLSEEMLHKKSCNYAVESFLMFLIWNIIFWN